MKAISDNYFEGRFECCACGEPADVRDVIPPALEYAYTGEAYEAAKDGSELPIGTCPVCGLKAFHVEDNICLVCGETGPYNEHDFC